MAAVQAGHGDAHRRHALEAAFGPVASPVGPVPGDPGAGWARAVTLGARGHYAAAEATLARLRADRGLPDVLRAHAAITRAAHLRQVGAHDVATGLDAIGLRLAHPHAAPPVPDPLGLGAAGAVADALVGLAADALGRWDTGSAGRLLARASPWCPDGGRAAVRWYWVRAETALLAGDPSGAVTAADAACRGATALGSPRHLLKSRLVLAVARSAAGDGDGADGAVVAELDGIAERAEATGLFSLVWPSLLAAADAAERMVAAGAPEVGTRTGMGEQPNERHARTSRPNTLSRQTDAQRRRHAAMAALNVVYLRCDPVARHSLRESAWIPAPSAVPYGLLHSDTHHPHDAEVAGDEFPDGGHKIAPTVSR